MRIWMSLGACVVLLLVSVSAHSYFRYVDENGKLVLSQTIPNERVRYGYDVLDQNGNLIERVEPQLTEAQYQRKLELEAAQQECLMKLDRTHKLYQSPGDIDYAEGQALKSLENRVSNTRANLTMAQNQLLEFESTAAQLDLAGKVIPDALLDNIARAKFQVDNLEQEITRRSAERGTLVNAYAFDRVVFGLEEKDCADGLPPEEQPERARN